MKGFASGPILAAGMACALLGVGLATPTNATHSKRKPESRIVNFNKDVRPILSEHCYACHGPSDKVGKGGLRLDKSASAFQKRGDFQAIKPGDAAHSEIFARMVSKDPDEVMPPPNSGKPGPTPEQREILRLWVQQGAKYEKHWALIPASMPTIPTEAEVGQKLAPIDAFLVQQLRPKNLSYNPEADKRTLIRRVALTLTGLPPHPTEVAQYLADSTATAYEKMVDRYLSSQRYGEHQARFWLDAVRYGDTHGLHLDNERAIYPYRDWVVRQYNNDLPFKNFIEWQLAGDMLPNPTREMLVATGYVRMNPTTSEGGAIVEEFLAKNTFDRVDTTSTVFLGLTVACARCHDHKYDPVTQKDYFRMYAFFNSTADEPLDGNLFTPDPVVKVPSPTQERRMAQLIATEKSLLGQVSADEVKNWIQIQKPQSPGLKAWEVSGPYVAKNFDEAYDAAYAPEKADQKAAWKPIDLKLGAALSFIGRDNAASYLQSTLIIPESKPYLFSIGSDDAVKVWVDNKLVHQNKALRGVEQATDTFTVQLEKGERKLLIKIVNGAGQDGVKLDIGSPFDRQVQDVKPKLDTPEGLLEAKKLYLTGGPVTASAMRYRDTVREKDELDRQIPSTLIAQELKKPRQAYVLRRGEYNLPDKAVSRAIPEVFGDLPNGAPRNRLGLAQWLSSPNHPLVSRVFVNRVWQQHFGTGLVKTSEDFGNQGEWPSHPELLDYLAVRFLKHQSLKQLHKEILLTKAFKQSSLVPAEKVKIDPENRLLSRGPRFRLDAEVIRDQALFTAGLLNEQRGGKGFKPYQPPRLWEEITFPGSNTSSYVQDTDKSIYRRSLYLFWKRTSPHPVVMAFDAPMRESCVVRRSRTNTPLQALVTLNETAFVEAARSLAMRVLNSNGSDLDKLNTAFLYTMSRPASDREKQILLASLADYRKEFEAKESEAKKLLSVGMLKPDPKYRPSEQAAWTLIANTLFNLDEFLTQH